MDRKGSRIRAIIFDIDGVLADSREAVVINTKTLLAEFGFQVDGSRVEGMSSAHSAESVLLSLVPSLSGDKLLLKKMLSRLSEITRENLHLVKPTGIAKEIPRLSKKYLLAVATNRKTSAKMVLERLGLEKHFLAVLTSADAEPKPSPQMIKLCLQRLGVFPHEAVFVGDNLEDRQAGESAGVRTIMIDGAKEPASKLLKKIAGLGLGKSRADLQVRHKKMPTDN
ncbi:MAG: HAD family hydrolase [Candidatus Micrarchaeota archaeon]|nr:HAD family hydrolase [Candidatus Micrarchaeota archaeon]